jgi:hypothetical protein
MIAVAAAILVLVVAAAVWVGAVEDWIGHELRSLVAARVHPTFGFDELTYTFPRMVTLNGVWLESPDPASPSETIEILAADSLSLVLSSIPWPNAPFRMQHLDIENPSLRLVRIRVGETSDGLLGFSNLLKGHSEPSEHPTRPPVKLSDQVQVRTISIVGGRTQYEPRDGSAAIMLIDGISAKLVLQPSDVGIYGIDFSLDHGSGLAFTMRGQVHADDQELEVTALSSKLQLMRENDHYLNPTLQKLVAKRNVTGRLKLEATGVVDLDDLTASRLKGDLELSDVGFAAGDYGLKLDHVASRIAVTGKSVRIEKSAIDAFGGHAEVTGRVELDDSLTAALSFEGADLRIGDMLRGADDAHGVPSFSGLLGFKVTLHGPLADIERHAQGHGRFSVRKARLARLPVLSTLDDALDRAAEAAMKRERVSHDALSFDFSLDGDHAVIEKLRMNSRWYGLRGHGEVYLDSRLNLAVDGGPLVKLENELGEAGEVMGEIGETLVRARVTGRLGQPKVGVEFLRHHDW